MLGLETSWWLLFEDIAMTDDMWGDVMIDNLDTSDGATEVITAITADIMEKEHNTNQFNKQTNIAPTVSLTYAQHASTCLIGNNTLLEESAYIYVTFIDNIQ